MASTPKKWVMQPFSPKLEQNDLRTLLSPKSEITGLGSGYNKASEPNVLTFDSITVVHSQPSVTVSSKVREGQRDVLVQARQVAVSNEDNNSEDWHPSSPSCPSSPSSAGSHSGFYSFVERSLSPEAEKTEAWMTSPEREAKLAILKEENGYKLRAYTEERRPEKLFQEGNGDSHYHVGDTEDTEEEQEQKQIQERLEIIRSQAPKVKPVFKDQWSDLERSLDLSYSPQRLLEGLSLSYGSQRGEVQQTGAEPGNIDTEKISFSAARQQFLMMEQSKRNPFLQSPQQLLHFPKHQGRPSQSEVMTVTSRKVNEDGLTEEQESQSKTVKPDPVEDQAVTSKIVTVSITEESGTKRQSSFFDDLDSGLGDLSLDPSGGYISDGSVSGEAWGAETGGGASSIGKGETPIEREIRIAQEREDSLRRERGIKCIDKEMVEIKTKPLLSQPGPSLTPTKPKEKNRVSFFIQREIEKECQREEDLQHQGKVPGLYDRGTAQELEERKRIFEQQTDQIPVMPIKRSLTGNLLDAVQVRSGGDTGKGTVERNSVSETENVLSPCCPHRHPDESLLRLSSSEYSTQILAAQKKNQGLAHAVPTLISEDKGGIEDGEGNRTTASPVVNSNDSHWRVASKGSASVRELFSAKDAPFSSPDTCSVSPLLGPAPAGKPTLRWSSHYEQFSLRPRSVRTPEAIRKEIEQEMKREEELRRQRAARGTSLFTNGSLDSSGQTASSADTNVPAPPQPNESDETSPQDLKLSTGQEEPSPAALPEEKAAKGRPRPSSFWGTDTVDFQETPLISPILTPDKTTIRASPSPSPHVATRLPSVYIMTAQPWTTPRQDSPSLPRVLPLMQQSTRGDAGGVTPQKGLTETLLEDFEERRTKQKLDESSYAGILPTDEVNNEVLEATRVTRHKNALTLRWEAGMYANEDGN
ncbi:mitotic interactor and substrate of PLK1 [Megalops cyprinoides]|uniref:mitotic interactor and substrate of PLK1 n=1 Tax=Megalops cyprinoides TaxID=118141 RepID=UPI00186555BC|nr:mitotic interactor and substrate of PLK1 [Megalops cyprinoides]